MFQFLSQSQLFSVVFPIANTFLEKVYYFHLLMYMLLLFYCFFLQNFSYSMLLYKLCCMIFSFCHSNTITNIIFWMFFYVWLKKILIDFSVEVRKGFEKISLENFPRKKNPAKLKLNFGGKKEQLLVQQHVDNSTKGVLRNLAVVGFESGHLLSEPCLLQITSSLK